ncbi:TPA: malonate decarboxylase holo-[acyl-carrier-protein] synthase [Legionella pneumophila]|uniref:Malonate decarboxylase holo-[acyl-carrier-protein] synthase n=1 Tax=Legionella pneumophila TaxID=446 RepID=A0A2S6EXI1_LEGPN|nr:malonate decarboxylase holo-[acyl-carrier-protein] synthase [Legionella pneumophila]APF04079.1 malonate decarboxylase holo-[acyl-carrier-protein] synthase [Legionella pneumophila subsp. fraseri]AUB69519.1 malonate decarboxylase holo-[acyl-carrier-protein] synthase [Legionella pneumophila]AUB72492.1 malonate decarboxylase holo-[acyl-carrier-protein] synthase [Legionella pneumophila]KXB25498.1 nucleotidyltransferase [Legionella pneumophila]KXB27755.1 nucleotidyltransferase [Legionella pneumop
MNYLRHTLCYLDKNTTTAILPAPGQLDLLQYWLKCEYPLIVTRQPEDVSCGQIQLAIPYFIPVRTQKLRASYVVDDSWVISTRALPSLQEIFPSLELDTSSKIQVYGSYCWQFLTREQYVQPSSDLDVLISYDNQSLFNLSALKKHLQKTLNINCIDGEIRFPALGECSWAELLQIQSSDSILFKTTKKVILVKRESLYANFPTLIA